MNIEVMIQSDGGQQRTEMCPASAPISIGRHPQCVLRLDSDLVSRQHAIVHPASGSMVVEDVSTNGTIAGDRVLRREALEVPYGTPIILGDFTLFFVPQGAADITAPPASVRQPAAAPNAMRAHQMTAPPAQLQAHHAPPPLPAANGHAQYHPPRPVPAATKVTQQPPSGNEMSQASADRDARAKDVGLRRDIHKALLEHLDLATIDTTKLDDPSMRPKVLNAIRRIVQTMAARIPKEIDHDTLIGELSDEALGLGPLERFLADPTITEIMVVDPNTIYIEQGGKLTLSGARFTDDERVRAVIERIVTPLGRRIDESSPLVDARLKDGSRVNAVIRPIALRGSTITIRKFSRTPLTIEKLISYGAITRQMATFLDRCVTAKKNIVISGGTGSGKTTLLNVLSASIPDDERIITIEDAAELQLKQPHVVSMETRPPNLEGRGEYSIRDLVKNALRMRPDRIVVGECRGGEALDMLQAMNTGHDGSLTTTHANSPIEAVARLETLALMAGLDLPVRAIRDQIAASVHIIVQQARLPDGSRKVTEISEIIGLGDHGEVELRSIFKFVRTGTGPNGKVIGEYRATGYLPSFLETFIVMGLVRSGEPYL